MTTNERIASTNDVSVLINIFANCKGLTYWNARRKIEKKVYILELPKIKCNLLPEATFYRRLSSPPTRLLMNDFPRLSNSLNKQIKNAEKMYHYLISNKSYVYIKRMVYKMDAPSKKLFEYASGVNLDKFFHLKKLEKH